MYNNKDRYSYDNWVVPGSADKQLTESKAKLPEVTALVEAASKAESPEEWTKTLNKLRNLLATLG